MILNTKENDSLPELNKSLERVLVTVEKGDETLTFTFTPNKKGEQLEKLSKLMSFIF